MPHDISLISTIAAGFGLALVFGYVAARLAMPPLVGYLLAGIVIGPATPGFVANINLAGQLAEIGVMLLMFGVGLHFSVDDLKAVWRIAIPGAIVQIFAAVTLGITVAVLWGWSIPSAIVFGLSLSVASTVVLLRALEKEGLLQSINGQIAVGWLVIEDLVMVLVLVLLPVLAGTLTGASGSPSSNLMTGKSGNIWLEIGITLGKISIFMILMLVVGKRIFPKILWLIARTGSRELFTLCVIAAAVGVAFGAAKLFGVSFALGAFFAGMMLRESEFSHRAANDSLPMRDAFSVLFFVSVGMLFDPSIVWQEPLKLIAVVAIIMIGKTLAAVALVLLMRYPLNTALTVGASLAQIGEFSFILAGLGVSLNLINTQAQSLILAGAFVSIAANTAVFSALEPLKKWALKHSALARQLELRDDPLAQLPLSTDQALLSNQVVIVGYGSIGKRLGHLLKESKVPFIVAEQNREIVENLRLHNIPAVNGNAAEAGVLIQAHIAGAKILLITLQDTINIQKIIRVATTLNPEIQVVLQTDQQETADLFQNSQNSTVFYNAHELANVLAQHVLKHLNLTPSNTDTV